MKSEKGITVIALLLVIIIIFGCIFAYKVMSDKKNTENASTSSIPSTSTNNNSSTNNSPSTSTNNNSSNTTALGKEFKQAMDSYEAFMDEYIAFMTKYSSSSAKTSQMFIDYGEYMKKYVDWADDFKNWEGKDLNKEEAKYYIEVQMRVNQKLMNASIDMSYQ